MHKQSISSTLINVFGSFLCVIILFVKQLLEEKKLDLGQLFGNGDIFIVCASMSISAVYAFYEFKDNKRDWSSWYFMLSIMNYALSVIFYLFVLLVEKSNTAMIILFSLVVFIINFIMTYASSYYSNLKVDASITRAEEGVQHERKLEEALKRG